MSTESPQQHLGPSESLEVVTLFIGLNSLTGRNTEESRARAIAILGESFPSFTVTEGTGFFRGKEEPVLVVHIATTLPQQAADCVARIRAELHQEGVGIAFRGHYFRSIEGHIPQIT